MKADNATKEESKRPSWVVLSILAAVVVAILASFFVAQEVERSEQQERRQAVRAKVERGSACSALRLADKAFSEDNDQTFRAAIKEAQREAIRALDTSRVLFRKPERMAMFLAEEIKRKPSVRIEERIGSRLAAALETCEKIRPS